MKNCMTYSLSIAVCFFFLASVSPAVADNSGSVTGRVIDSVNGGPLSGSIVILETPGTVTRIESKPFQGVRLLLETTDRENLRAISNMTGEYCFAYLKPGAYVVYAVMVYHSSAEVKVTVTAGHTAQADISLPPRTGRHIYSEPPHLTQAEIKSWLGTQAVSILAGATRVQAFRVETSLEGMELKQDDNPQTFRRLFPRVDGCYLAATAEEKGPTLAQKISGVLLDETTYSNFRRVDFTIPGVVFRLWKGSQSLDVVLCSGCREIYTVTRDATGKGTYGIYTVLGRDSYSTFARLAKEAFPNDPVIQTL